MRTTPAKATPLGSYSMYTSLRSYVRPSPGFGRNSTGAVFEDWMSAWLKVTSMNLNCSEGLMVLSTVMALILGLN